MSALNQAVAHASGEIIAFTDANAMLEEATLKRLVASFADREVGGVCGNQKYRSTDAGDSAGKGENLYWTYDKFLKHLENKVGSIIAADGSIYAIRKNLFVALDDGAQADDFAISVRVITQGRRLVYEPGAISYEEPPAASDNEFRRKIRVTNHSLRGILNVSEALNPLRTGFYAVELWSHKLLRYMAPLFMITAFAANAFLLAGESGFYHILMLGQMLFYGGALAGYMLRHTKWGRLKFFYVPFYFCLVNAAALLGMLSLLKGDRITVWQPQRDITQVGENKR
jgi:cellulose synthase/poly-beta-1,6-N-acetylglucosamine synthase-like glycosyltransferase